MEVLEDGNTSSNLTGEVEWPSVADIISTPHWYLSTAISVIVILANLWIAFSFIHHAVTNKIIKKSTTRHDVNGGMVVVSAMVAIVSPFIRYFGTLFFLIVSLYPDCTGGCEVANDVSVVGFVLAIFPSYGFLWARQRAFYGHPSLGPMFGTCVSVFSNISLVLILLSAFVSLGLAVVPKEYEHGPGGCFLIGSEEQDEYRTYVYAVVMITSQLVLLGLFLHPIRIHTLSKKDYGNNRDVKSKAEQLSPSECPSGSWNGLNTSGGEESETNNSICGSNKHIEPNAKQSRALSMPAIAQIKRKKDKTDEKRTRSEANSRDKRKRTVIHAEKNGFKIDYFSKASKVVCKFKNGVRSSTMKNKKVFRLIKRVLYLALISICSDLTVMIVTAFVVPDDIPQTYSFVMYDVSILINVIIVVVSFESWRKRMSSPCMTSIMI